MKNLETFLKKIGVKSETISKLSSEEELNVEDFVKTYKESLREVYANDPDFIQPIKDEIRGSELSKIEHKIKKTFGLSSDEIKDKKFDEIISLASEKSKSVGSSTTDDLQKKLVELANENKRLLEEVIPSKENEAKETIKNFRKDSTLRSILSSKSLIVSPEVVIPAIQTHLNSNYSIDLGEDGSFIVKTKNGLNPLNEDGTKVVGFEEILDSQLKTLGVLKQSNAGTSGGTTGGERKSIFTKTEGESPKFNLPGLKVAEENAEKMKNIRTFGNK
jgi:hypothetical protein